MKHPFIHRQNQRAFSLIELLVVMAIIGIMVKLTLPSFSQILRGSNLTVSVQKVVDELNLARQTAISKNRYVEVRFYKLPPDPSETLKPDHFRGLQSFILENEEAIPIGKAVYLPAPIIFSPENARYSTLLDPGKEKTSDQALPLGEYKKNYRYIAFRFRPSGETDLSHESTHVTLLSLTDLLTSKTAGKDLPKDFVTIQIDSFTGRVKVFRL